MEWFEETLHTGWRQKLKVNKVLFSEKTQHQDLVVFESEDWGTVLALDGVVQTTSVDEFAYHEMLVHPPLMAHPAPAEVLIIGGGDGGSLRESLRHQAVRRVTQVEIDRGVIDFCTQYLPDIGQGSFDDPRADVVIDDGARFAAETDRRFDVVIIDSTDPIGPGEVLFSERFYTDCRRILTSGGIMTTQSGNPAVAPSVLVDGQRRLRAAGFATVDFYLTSVPTYVGGMMALGWATDGSGAAAIDVAELKKRTLPSDLRYYTPELQAAAFVHPAWMDHLVAAKAA